MTQTGVLINSILSQGTTINRHSPRMNFFIVFFQLKIYEMKQPQRERTAPQNWCLTNTNRNGPQEVHNSQVHQMKINEKQIKKIVNKRKPQCSEPQNNHHSLIDIKGQCILHWHQYRIPANQQANDQVKPNLNVKHYIYKSGKTNLQEKSCSLRIKK